MDMLEHNARAKEERRRLDFDNSWNKATAWWRALPNGVKSDYKGLNPDRAAKGAGAGKVFSSTLAF